MNCVPSALFFIDYGIADVGVVLLEGGRGLACLHGLEKTSRWAKLQNLTTAQRDYTNFSSRSYLPLKAGGQAPGAKVGPMSFCQNERAHCVYIAISFQFFTASVCFLVAPYFLHVPFNLIYLFSSRFFSFLYVSAISFLFYRSFFFPFSIFLYI
jgi:hypothetical protein